MRIEDKVAIVTGGGGRGTGRAIARRLARAGAAIVVGDIDEEGGAETVREIEAGAGRAAFTRADVTREHDIDELVVSYVRQAFGRQITVRLDRIPDTEKRDPDVIGPCEPSKFPGQLVIGLLVAPAGSAVARVPAFMLHFAA